MRLITAVTTALPLLAAAAPPAHRAVTSHTSLIVDQAPQSPRPYVLLKNTGLAVSIGQQVYRFSVTGNASAGAFTLLQTNAPDSTELGVLPHVHKTHYENFYVTKGRVQLWTKTNATEERARVLTAGDYGAAPHNTIHTFQITDPDTQLTGVIQPGGFEALFLAIADGPFTSSTNAPFVPTKPTNSGAGSDPSAISALEHFDVFAQLAFSPRRDFVNGTAGGSGYWHDGPNTLAPDAVTPNFIAKNYGPKYLNTDGGVYQLLAPLATAKQTAGNFSMGTLTLSPLQANQTATRMRLRQPVAFQLEEGALVVDVEGYDAATLIQGDVVFVPAGVKFSYSASATYTKFLYVSGGKDGFDYQLLQNAHAWNFTTYPTYTGFTVQ